MGEGPGFRDAEAKRIIERAAEIDAERGQGLDALALREIAAEAGISALAVDKAIEEHGLARPTRLPWFKRHRTPLVTITTIVAALFIFAVARTVPPSDEAGFSGKGVESGVPQIVDQSQTYFEFQVEKPVAPIPGTGSPRYPDALRSSGVEGEVQAQFVVNEDGRAETSTFRVLKATNDLFASAVSSELPNMRFNAAEIGGKKVKQLVQQSFQFKLDR